MDARGNDPAGVFSWGIDDDDLVDNNVNNFFEENNENNYLFVIYSFFKFIFKLKLF